MLHSIGSVAASSGVGTNLSKEISQANIAGVLIIAESYGTVDKTQISVKLRTEDNGQDVLIPQMPLWPLAERADYMGGVGLGAIKEKSLQNGSDPQEAIEIDQVAMFLPLGQVNLQDGDELEVDFVVTSAFASTDSLQAWFFDPGPGQESLLKVVEQGVDNATFRDPEEVWIYETSAGTNDKSLATLAAGALNVNMKVGEESYTNDARGYWGLAAAIGRFEGTGPRRTVPVYLDKMGRRPGANVAISLTGSARNSYSIFAIERVVHPKREATVKAELLDKRASAIEKAAAKDPARIAALQLAKKIELPKNLRLEAAQVRDIARRIGL